MLARGQGKIRLGPLAPINQRNVRRLARRGKPQAGNVGEERREAIGENGLADLDRNDDRRGGLVRHCAAGRSPTVSVSSTGSPARLSESLIEVPTLSGPSVRRR